MFLMILVVSWKVGRIKSSFLSWNVKRTKLE
jgi:hypothetical protein